MSSNINRANIRFYIEFLKEYLAGEWNFPIGGLCYAASKKYKHEKEMKWFISYIFWDRMQEFEPTAQLTKNWNKSRYIQGAGPTPMRKEMAAKLLEILQKYNKERYSSKKQQKAPKEEIEYFNRYSDKIAEAMESEHVGSWYSYINEEIANATLAACTKYCDDSVCDIFDYEEKEIFCTLLWIVDDETLNKILIQLYQ